MTPPPSAAAPRAERTRPAPPPTASRLRRALTRLLAAALLGLAGCGEAPGGAGAGEAADAAARPEGAPPLRWRVPPASPAEQARFALERLLTGPVPQDVLALPEQHPDTLRLARADLVVLGDETLRVLAEPAVEARIVGPEVRNLDGWHNVLEVLAALPAKDPALVLRYTEPALARRVPGLTLRAVDALASLQDVAAAPLLLRFLEVGSDDRNVQRQVWRALGALPAPWPAEALRWLRVRGLPEVWLDVPQLLGARLSAGEDSLALANLLGWWALLTEPGGPRTLAGTPRHKSLPWSLLRPAFDAAAPAPLPGGAPGARCPGPLPAAMVDGLGWLSVPPGESAVLSPYALSFLGTEPAADARCALAMVGRPAFVRSVQRDRTSPDPLLAERARHCMLEGRAALDAPALAEDAHRLLAWARELAEQGGHPTASEVAEAARRLPEPTDPAGRAALLALLDGLRPVSDWLSVLEAAYLRLLGAQDGSAQDRALAWLAGEAPTERGLALHLAQKSRDPALLPALEALLERSAPAARGTVLRVLWWIHAGRAAEPGRTAAFAQRYAAVVDAAADPQALSLATGLLDLGPAGVEAFVARLRGDRSALFVDACASLPDVLPTAVAEALADLLDARLTAARRERILLALWRAAPADAAGAVAAAKGRLAPPDRPAVDVVLEVVRHRAARPRS